MSNAFVYVAAAEAQSMFYPKDSANRQKYATSLDLGDELAERLLVEF